MTCLKFDNLYFRHPYDDFDVFCGATFNVERPLSTVLIDRQCGKTTFCRLLTGELKPQKGQVLVNGVSVCDIKPKSADMLYLSAEPVFFRHKTVEYNIVYPLVLRKVKRDICKSTVSEVAKQLSIDELLQNPLRKLTDDEQRLVALARGLTVPRGVVLFDDFFVGGKRAETAFDSYDEQLVFRLFEQAAKVVVTSDVNVAVGVCTVIDGGKCVFCGEKSEAEEVIRNLSW